MSTKWRKVTCKIYVVIFYLYYPLFLHVFFTKVYHCVRLRLRGDCGIPQSSPVLCLDPVRWLQRAAVCWMGSLYSLEEGERFTCLFLTDDAKEMVVISFFHWLIITCHIFSFLKWRNGILGYWNRNREKWVKCRMVGTPPKLGMGLKPKNVCLYLQYCWS